MKLLPAALAEDAERVARFQREAQLLASLNHPHIGAIYGLEQDASARFLVLELVDGGTLADRIALGRVALEEALDIARQIALALQVAHDRGIIHRDLKPSNVAFTTAGDVKVLDFGLAKLTDVGPLRGDPHVPTDVGVALGQPDVSASPTITSPALATVVGRLLGTAAYMAPEQARGRPADKRSDVWSFGCVLYEMLTGARAFKGEDVSDTLANVLKLEPDWSRLPSPLPPAIRVLLRRCLAKDARQRCGDMAAALILIEESPHLASAVPLSATPPRRPVFRRAAIATAVVLAAAAAGAVWKVLEPATPRIVKTAILLTGNAALRLTTTERPFALTPDGARIVYVGDEGRQVLVRALNELEPRPLTKGANIRNVFVSSDGQWAGYMAGTTLMKVALSGGPATPIARVDSGSRGATWLPDNTIVFATANAATGLQRVAATGGTVTGLTKPDQQQGETDHLYPNDCPTDAP